MYNLYVDGGGTTTVPCYFSYKCLEAESIQMNRFYLHNLAYELIPQGCDIFNSDGKQTNNLAEVLSIYYGLKKFKESYDYHPVNIFHDSQIIVYSVLKINQCQAEHLIPWVTAVQSLWWPSVNYQWVRRENIVKVLGH